MSGIGQQVGSALGGGANPLQSIGTGGMGLGNMPAPMQNPFLGGSSGGGMSQPMPAGWEPKFSSVNTTTTQDIMGRGSSGVPFPQGPGAGISPEMLSMLLQGTPSGANGPYPALASTLPVNVPQRKFAGAMPSIKEFRDATGADFKTASDLLYGVVGSSKDTRDWQKIFASPDPIAAARQATAAMYGGVKQGTYTDPVTGKQNTMLMSGTGMPLTTAGNRDVNFGVGLAPNSGANFVSGLATNARFPGAGAQQIQGQMPLQPQGQMPLQNPPTMGAGSGTSQPMTTQDLIARLSGLLGLQGGGMGQPYISDRGYFGPGTMSNPTGPQFGQEGVVTQVSRPPEQLQQEIDRLRGALISPPKGDVTFQPYPTDPQYGGGMGRLVPPQVSRQPDFFSRRYGGGMGAGLAGLFSRLTNPLPRPQVFPTQTPPGMEARRGMGGTYFVPVGTPYDPQMG